MEKSNQMCLAQEVWLRAWTATASHVHVISTCNAMADKCLEEFSRRWSMTPEEEGERIDM